MKIKANPAQCEELYKARTASNKKQLKKLVFSQIRTANRLQGSAKLGVRNITNPDKENYGVLYDKRTRVDLDDGRQAPVVVAEPVVVTPKAVIAPVKPVAKPVVKAAPKASVAVPGVSPVRTAKHTIEIRTTILGVRKRLGFASSEKAKAAAIAAAKG
jgi:hypothetical protein